MQPIGTEPNEVEQLTPHGIGILVDSTRQNSLVASRGVAPNWNLTGKSPPKRTKCQLLEEMRPILASEPSTLQSESEPHSA